MRGPDEQKPSWVDDDDEPAGALSSEQSKFSYDEAKNNCFKSVQKLAGVPESFAWDNVHPAAQSSFDLIIEDRRRGLITEEKAKEQFGKLEKLIGRILENPDMITADQTQAVIEFQKSVEADSKNAKKGFFGRHPILCVAAIVAVVALVAGFVALCVLSGGIAPAGLAIAAFTAKVAVPVVAHFFVATVVPFLHGVMIAAGAGAQGAAMSAGAAVHSAAIWAGSSVHSAGMAAAAALHGPAMTVAASLKSVAIFTGKFVMVNPIFTAVAGTIAIAATSLVTYGVHGLFNPKEKVADKNEKHGVDVQPEVSTTLSDSSSPGSEVRSTNPFDDDDEDEQASTPRCV